MNTRHKVGGFPTIIIIIVIMGDHHCPTIWRFMQTSSNFSLTGFVYRTRSHVKGFVYCTQPVVSDFPSENLTPSCMILNVHSVYRQPSSMPSTSPWSPTSTTTQTTTTPSCMILNVHSVYLHPFIVNLLNLASTTLKRSFSTVLNIERMSYLCSYLMHGICWYRIAWWKSLNGKFACIRFVIR